MRALLPIRDNRHPERHHVTRESKIRQTKERETRTDNDGRLERMISRRAFAPQRGRARGWGLMTNAINYHRDCTSTYLFRVRAADREPRGSELRNYPAAVRLGVFVRLFVHSLAHSSVHSLSRNRRPREMSLCLSKMGMSAEVDYREMQISVEEEKDVALRRNDPGRNGESQENSGNFK